MGKLTHGRLKDSSQQGNKFARPHRGVPPGWQRLSLGWPSETTRKAR